MNNQVTAGHGLERALVATLDELLGEVGWLGKARTHGAGRSAPDGADVIVHVGVEKVRGAELRVHVEKDLRPGAFPAWAERRRFVSKKAVVPVLAMPLVSQRLAGLCREAGWSWYDLAGNCRIDLPGLLHVERSGIAPIRRPPRPGANLGTAAAARVLRALLSPTHAGLLWTQRSLQAGTRWSRNDEGEPVSLGLVNKVVRHLRDEGFVEGAGARGVRVRDPIGLLEAWSKAYRFERHERRSCFSLLKGAELHEALCLVGLDAGGMAAYAAFSAAEIQAPHVRQHKTWLYVGSSFLDSLMRHAQAKEVDSGENLVVLVPDDAGVFPSFDEGSRASARERGLGCTDPVQTYVDLVHLGGRGEEAAQALLDQRILPAWKAVASA